MGIMMNKKQSGLTILAYTLVMTLWVGGCSSPSSPGGTTGEAKIPAAPLRPEGKFDGTVTLKNGDKVKVPFNYIVDLPPGYDPGSGQKYRLIVHLHGAGGTEVPIEQFREIRRQDALAAAYQDYPAIILFPQLPSHLLSWKAMGPAVIELMDTIVETYPIDNEHIYLTGYSDGGYGALAVGALFPDRFDAVAAVAGYYPPENLKEICALKNTPVYIYHGWQDIVVPIQASLDAFDALKDCNGNVTLTLYSDADHGDIADRVFNNIELYARLFQH